MADYDLIDLILMIKSRAKLMLAVFLLTLVLVVFGFLALPAKYEVYTVLEPSMMAVEDSNGQVIDQRPLVSPQGIKDKIVRGAYKQQMLSKLDIAEGDYPEVIVYLSKDEELIRLSVIDSNPEKAVAVLNGLLKIVIDEIDERRNVEIDLVGKKIDLVRVSEDSFKNMRALLNVQVVDIRNKIGELEKYRQEAMNGNSDNTLAILLYSNEIQNKQIYLNSLEQKLKETESEILSSAIKAKNLKVKLSRITVNSVKGKPVVPTRRYGPGLLLVTVVGGILGALLSFVVALISVAVSTHTIRLRNDNGV